MASGYKNPSLYSTAISALQKFVEIEQNDGSAFNLLGLLFERQGRYMDAAKSFHAAFEILASAEEPDTKKIMSVAANHGRACLSSGSYNEAIQSYSLVLGSLELPGHVYHILGCGLAYYFNGQLEESLNQFQRALEDCKDDEKTEIKSDVMLLLSQVLYGLGTEQHISLAKEQLFQW